MIHYTNGGASPDKPGELMVVCHALEIHKPFLLTTIKSTIVNVFIILKVQFPLSVVHQLLLPKISQLEAKQ